MKIIKIAHANTTIETENERESFSIKNYNIHNFLLQQEAEIIEETQKAFEKILEYKNKPLPKTNVFDYLLSFPLPTDKIRDAGINAIETLFTQKERREEFAKLVIRKTIATILPNITNQMEKVEIISLEIARKKYPRSRNLSIGTYTLHPRDGLRLTRLEHYHKNLALEKDDELIVLLGRMGAKSLKIMEIDNSQKSGTINTGVDTVLVDAKGGVNFSSEFEKNKDLVVNFEGNYVDIDSNLLENSLWFSDDSKLISIFESRRFNLNKIQEYTLRNTYTETFDFDFNLAARYLTNQADLNGEYQAISKKERFFHIEFGK
ncbi:hypothetical protein [Microcoleus sp. N9_A1]|uniref:hypothetical protein n=1 Tax=Microcoleus sp. N9_A1 TaxID=3055380 RepID=UPI002FCE8EA1